MMQLAEVGGLILITLSYCFHTIVVHNELSNYGVQIY